MKKLISIAVTVILTLGTGGILAWQSGGTATACELPNCSQTITHSHSVCVVSDCTQSINHEHNGIIYYAHYESDSHDHQLSESIPTQDSAMQVSTFRCDVSECAVTDEHTHILCDQANCTLMSNHSHNDIIYFGHGDNDGHNHHQQNAASDTVLTTVPYNCGVSDCLKTEWHDHTVCNQPDCDQTTNHNHNGLIYFGHNDNDWHGHNRQSEAPATSESIPEPLFNCGMSDCNIATTHSHTNCTVSGCNQMTNHEHNGFIYYGHNYSDGHAYHNCGVSDCMQTNSHNHNSCGVNGCNNTGHHSHDNKNGGNKSKHGGGHH